MTFNDNAKISTGGVSKVGGRTGAAVGGGSVLLLIIGFIVYLVTGVDITGIGGSGQQQGAPQETGQIENCRTGADANRDVECRMAGAQNSLDQYWASQADALGIRYVTPGFTLYNGQTESACGTASNDVGPFYCPEDSTMYVDASFFKLLETQFGAEDGPAAELYIVGHEWGHHIQHLTGVLQQANSQETGPESDSVRLELQADCFAGAWERHASETTDANGTQLIQPLTDEQIRNALDAASAVGDDHIQQQQGGRANPESFTHGTSEQRQRWFTSGYQGGWQACDTFSAPSL